MGRKLKIFIGGIAVIAALGGLSNTKPVRSKIIDMRAESASAQQLFTYTNMYQAGIRVNPDREKAVEYARRAANMGHAMAQHRLGYYYDTGYMGVRDITMAIGWYQKSAAQDLGKSHFALASIYWSGDLGEVYTKRALSHDIIAAKLGIKNSNLRLGIVYQDGDHGVKTDHNRAIYYLKRALKQGSPHAAHRLGDQFWSGHGVKSDLEMATILYFVSHHLGNSREAYTYALKHLEPDSEREIILKANAYVMLELCPYLDRKELCKIKGAQDNSITALRGTAPL